MQQLFFVIPIQHSSIGKGTCLLFGFLLSLILTMEIGVVVLCRSKFGIFEATTIATATLITFSSLLMILISLCLIKWEIYSTWMFSTVMFFLIQTVVVICLAAVNGATIAEGGPYSSQIALAQLELFFILPAYLFTWAHMGHLWLCLHSLYNQKMDTLKKIAPCNEVSVLDDQTNEVYPASAESETELSKSHSELLLEPETNS